MIVALSDITKKWILVEIGLHVALLLDAPDHVPSSVAEDAT